MKRRTKGPAWLLAVLFLLTVLAACAPAASVDTADGSSGGSLKVSASPTDIRQTGALAAETPFISYAPPYYSIGYDGNAADQFPDAPSAAKAGETVELRTGVLYDADIHVYVDGQEIEKSHYDSDYWGYAFTMPDNNVRVTAVFYTKEEVWGPDPADPPGK